MSASCITHDAGPTLWPRTSRGGWSRSSHERSAALERTAAMVANVSAQANAILVLDITPRYGCRLSMPNYATPNSQSRVELPTRKTSKPRRNIEAARRFSSCLGSFGRCVVGRSLGVGSWELGSWVVVVLTRRSLEQFRYPEHEQRIADAV